jgi:Protein of unknown function (DUF3987)
MDAVDHGKLVLAAILHGRKDLLELALKRLTSKDFCDPQQSTMLELCRRYHSRYQMVLTRDAISDILRDQQPGMALQYQTYFDALVTQKPSDEEFHASLDQLRELAAERLIGEALSQAMEILRRGASHDGRRLHGAADARLWVLRQFAEVDGINQPEPAVLAPVPEYPLAQIAGPLGELVSSTTLPAPLVGGAGLAVLAALAGNADLIMPDGSRQRPILWIPLLAPRTGGKSPALDGRALETLRRLDITAHEEYRRELDAWKNAGPDSDIERPVNSRVVIDDITIEALACHLERGTGVALAAPDELSGWLQAIGQYKRTSGDKGRWLALWTGAPWSYQRRGSNSMGDGLGTDIYLSRPVVVVTGGLQPHLHHLLGDTDSGMRARWLPHYSAEVSPTWCNWSQDPAARLAWETAVQRMHASRNRRREWQLGSEAEAAWLAAGRHWKAQQHRGDAAAPGLGKADLHAARIALVIAESMYVPGMPEGGGLDLEHGLGLGFGDPPPAAAARRVIGLEAMTSAIAIVDYAMAVWMALPGEEPFALSFRQEKLSRKVETLRAWLEERPGRSATRREMMRAAVAGVRKATDLTTLLTEYEAVYPGTVGRYEPEAGGPSALRVHAPQRGDAQSSETPPAGKTPLSAWTT